MRLILTGFLVTLLILTSGCASFFAPWFPPKEKEVRQDLQSEHSWLGKEQSESEKKAGTVLHTQLAGAYYNRRQFKIAIDEANKALKANPNYAPAYNVLGLIYMDLHEDKLAKENFERALEIAPKDPETHNNFGWFLCQRMPEQADQAMKHFMAALKDSLYSTPEMANTNGRYLRAESWKLQKCREIFSAGISIETCISSGFDRSGRDPLYEWKFTCRKVKSITLHAHFFHPYS